MPSGCAGKSGRRQSSTVRRLCGNARLRRRGAESGPRPRGGKGRAFVAGLGLGTALLARRPGAGLAALGARPRPGAPFLARQTARARSRSLLPGAGATGRRALPAEAAMRARRRYRARRRRRERPPSSVADCGDPPEPTVNQSLSVVAARSRRGAAMLRPSLRPGSCPGSPTTRGWSLSAVRALRAAAARGRSPSSASRALSRLTQRRRADLVRPWRPAGLRGNDLSFYRRRDRRARPRAAFR